MTNERSGRAYTVVYDGDCRVCRRTTDILRKWSRNDEIEVVAWQAPGVTERFSWIPPETFSEAMQLIAPDGTTWQGAAAIEQLLGVLPRGRWISWVFHVPFARTLADRFYRWFARNRYRLGCGAHCTAASSQPD